MLVSPLPDWRPLRRVPLPPESAPRRIVRLPLRLVSRAPVFAGRGGRVPGAAQDLADWLDAQGEAELARKARRYADASALGAELELAGPVGERNLYALHPRGGVLLVPETRGGLIEQMAAVLATGNRGVV